MSNNEVNGASRDWNNNHCRNCIARVRCAEGFLRTRVRFRHPPASPATTLSRLFTRSRRTEIFRDVTYFVDVDTRGHTGQLRSNVSICSATWFARETRVGRTIRRRLTLADYARSLVWYYVRRSATNTHYERSAGYRKHRTGAFSRSYERKSIHKYNIYVCTTNKTRLKIPLEIKTVRAYTTITACGVIYLSRPYEKQ